MTTRTAPFRHTDGSNCWTKNCSRGNTTAEREALSREILAARKKIVQQAAALPTAAQFEEAAKLNRIYGQKHPTYPYTIYKYMKSTAYTSDWDDVTMQARGVIINDETGEIIAVPFKKFFNYSEGKTDEKDMTGPIVVSEKMDGSLGVLFPAPDGRLEVTTSGGFSAPQADFATKVYREKYEGNWEPNPELTYLYEIIYPKNRIVVNYGEERDIYLLGAVNKKTGKSVPLNEINEWPGPRAEVHEFNSLADVVSAPDRPNHEGYIIHFTDTDTRVKVKHDEYVKLHRVATGLDEKAVWDIYTSIDNPDEFNSWRGKVEEEFLPFIDQKKAELESKKQALFTEADNLLTTLPVNASGRDVAEAVKAYKHPNKEAQGIIRDMVFKKYRGQTVGGEMFNKAIRRYLQPEGRGESMWATSSPEDQRDTP